MLVVFAVFLPDFKYGLFARDIVAAMPVEEQEASKAVRDKVFKQATEKVKVDARFCGESAGEIQVVVGISKPLQGCKKSPISKGKLGTAGDFPHQKRVGGDGEVGAVLLEGGDRKNNRRIPV